MLLVGSPWALRALRHEPVEANYGDGVIHAAGRGPGRRDFNEITTPAVTDYGDARRAV